MRTNLVVTFIALQCFLFVPRHGYALNLKSAHVVEVDVTEKRIGIASKEHSAQPDYFQYNEHTNLEGVASWPELLGKDISLQAYEGAGEESEEDGEDYQTLNDVKVLTDNLAK